MQTEQGWHAPDCQPIVSRRSIRVRQIHKRVKTLRILVGATGFEPATPCAQGRCATRLRYAPTPGIIARAARPPRRIRRRQFRAACLPDKYSLTLDSARTIDDAADSSA